MFIFQWQQASCPILYFVIEYKLANQLDWTIGDLSKQSLQLNHEQLIITTALCAVTNNLQVQDVYSIRGLQPATSYDLKVKKKQKNSGIMVIMTNDHRYIILIVPTNQVTAHNHAGSRSAAYQFSTLTPLGSPARSQFTIHMSLSSLSPCVLTFPMSSSCPHAAIS